MSVPGVIAFCIGVVVISGLVFGLGYLARDAERDSRRRILEYREAEKETEDLVHRLIYGEEHDDSASGPASFGKRDAESHQSSRSDLKD